MPAARLVENREHYEAPDALAFYAGQRGLQPAERAILNRLAPRLPGMDMLDVGVGAGRTTAYFAPIARTYRGIDAAANMVAACRARFPAFVFETADARRLEGVADESLDFVLFSFNGLDCLDFSGRQAALRRFFAVLRPGGVLAFSSHNIRFLSAAALAGDMARRDPFAMFQRFRANLRFRRSVHSVRFDENMLTARVVERQLGRLVEIAYVDAAHQARQLREIGFAETALFGGEAGGAVAPGAEGPDRWIYFLCAKPAANPASASQPPS